MARDWRHIVLWEYPEETSVETLLRHQRRAKWLVYVGTGASVLAMSSMFEFLASKEGTLRDILFVVLCASCGVSLLLSIPVILAFCWLGDIHKALIARGHTDTTHDAVGWRVGVTAMKMCFWFIAMLVLANYVLD